MLRETPLPVPLFSEKSAWRESVSEVGLDPKCAARMEATRVMLEQYGTSIGKDINAFWVNLDEFTVPVFIGRRPSIRLRTYCGQEWGTHDPASLSEQGELRVPGLPETIGPVRPAGPLGKESDGHLVLYDAESHTEYDFFQATTQIIDGQSAGGGIEGDAILEAGSITRFRLDGVGAQIAGPDQIPLNSARASGVALLAGLIVPEDFKAVIPSDLSETTVRPIAHALAFAMPRLRCLAHDCSGDFASDFVYPASKTETSNHSSDPLAWAAGERVRLTSTLYFRDGTSFDENTPGISQITKIFLATLRQYGAYLLDGAGSVSFYAEEVTTANLKVTTDEMEWLIGRQPHEEETPWSAVINTLNEQISWKLATLQGLPSQPLPFIVPGPSDPLGNVELLLPARSSTG